MASPLSRLFLYAQQQRKDMLVASLYSVLNKLFDIFPEILIGVAVDTVVRKENSFVASLGITNTLTQLIIIGGITFTIFVLESLFQYLYSLKWRTLAQALQHTLRTQVYEHTQTLNMAFFESQKTGNLSAILNDDINQLERFLDFGMNKIIQICVSTLAVGAIFFYLAPLLAVFAMLPVPVIIACAYAFQKRLGKRYVLVRESAGAISSRLANNIHGITHIKSFAAEQFEKDNLVSDSLSYVEKNTAAIRLSAAFIPTVRIAIVAGFIVTLIMGGYYALEGYLAIGSYSVLVFLSQRFLWPFTELAELTDQYQRANASTMRIFSLLDNKAIEHSGSQQLDMSQVKGSLSFENVSFTYPNNTHVLKNFFYRIPAGHTIAFVGPTGSGKTTLIKLLMRFYEPNEGEVLLDGKPISSFSLASLRHTIGFVSQDVFVFPGTVRENIAYGRNDATDEQIIRAAQFAQAHEFIIKLSQGYNTPLGERGQTLSGGQRQRLSIARAVLKDPPILILDEATSAVDHETEEAIQRSLQKLVIGRTTIVVAHRLSTIRHANRIVVMDKGQIVESGTHHELLLNNALYANLWRIQVGGNGEV